MVEKTREVSLPLDSMGSGASLIVQEYNSQRDLFLEQPVLVQRFLENQARNIAEAVCGNLPQVRFTLPDRVVSPATPGHPLTVPTEEREQLAGGLMDRLTRTDLRAALRQRLGDLEGSKHQAVVLGAGLIRYATVIQLVHHMLPSGRSVTYIDVEGEAIPTVPVKDELEPASAITAATDAIVQEGSEEAGRGELIVPYVAWARRFYLPQWIAFNEDGNLLVKSTNEAEAHVASMQNFLSVLHTAVALAPYIVADPEYQQKRYGILGQLVNQGRALARYETSEIIRTVQHRAKAQDLNRGLSLSLPFFDDQELVMQTRAIEVIPAGRIMFVPAFVVHAARGEQAKVAQDTRLSSSTRRHLLEELATLEKAFLTK
jgi:hypothetical protein